MKIVKPFFIIGIAVAVNLSQAGCNAKQPQSPQSKKEIIPVKVIGVELRDIQESLDYVGTIEAQNEAIIYPKVSGKISEKIKEEGASVLKDETIVFIDRDEVGLKFEKAPVVSTLNGVVGKLFVDLGQHVNLQTPIAQVMDIEKIKIKLDIPEKYTAQLSLGLKAKIKVDAYPQQEFNGEVTKIIPVVELTSRTLPIEITGDNPGLILKPGMFARVSLILKKYEKTPVILKEALLDTKDEPAVYIIENNRAFLRKIKLGIKDGPYYQVTAGLKPGDLVVIMGQQRLYESAEVKIELEE